MVRRLGTSGGTGSSFSITAPTDEYVEEVTEDPVQISPGQDEAIITVTPEDGGLWYEVGSVDATFTKYNWLLDGEALFDSPTTEPLGLYNSPHRFPHPLVFNDQIQVRASRDNDAAGAEEYFSKIRYVPIKEGQVEKLRNALQQL